MKRTTLLIGLLVAAPLASAETFMDIGFSPSSGNYDGGFGVGIYQLNSGGMGLYLNGLITLDMHEPYYEALTVSSFGDPVRDRRNDIALFNVGATISPSDNLSFYAGVGYASAGGYAEKYDPLLILGSNGVYYTPDSERDESGENFNGGIIFTGEQYGVNLGYNSYNGAVYIGVGGKF